MRIFSARRGAVLQRLVTAEATQPSICPWDCTSSADALVRGRAAWEILPTRTRTQAALVRIEHPDRLHYCGTPVQPTLNWFRQATGNCGVPPCFWKRAAPGIEPGTSRTLSENHTTRPSSHCTTLGFVYTTHLSPPLTVSLAITDTVLMSARLDLFATSEISGVLIPI